jgi:hypothetical protein
LPVLEPTKHGRQQRNVADIPAVGAAREWLLADAGNAVDGG